MIIVTSLFLLLASSGPANAYQMETRWRSEDGAQVLLSANAGKQVLLSFVYTSCGATCPLTTKRLQRLERAMKKAKKATRIVVVSLDPEGDTPEAVRAYRAQYGLTGDRQWEVLVGDAGALRTLTMLLDFRFSKNPESGAIMHDNKIFLLSKNGEVLVTTSSIEGEDDALLAALN